MRGQWSARKLGDVVEDFIVTIADATYDELPGVSSLYNGNAPWIRVDFRALIVETIKESESWRLQQG